VLKKHENFYYYFFIKNIFGPIHLVLFLNKLHIKTCKNFKIVERCEQMVENLQSTLQTFAHKLIKFLIM
jgi:hypothetical protein